MCRRWPMPSAPPPPSSKPRARWRPKNSSWPPTAACCTSCARKTPARSFTKPRRRATAPPAKAAPTAPGWPRMAWPTWPACWQPAPMPSPSTRHCCRVRASPSTACWPSLRRCATSKPLPVWCRTWARPERLRPVIPFLNHRCPSPASLAVHSCCLRSAVAFTNDLEMESEGKDLPRIEDVLRVQRLLDRAHHVHRAGAGFIEQKTHLVQAHAMLAGAGAVQAQGAGHQLVVQRFGGNALFGVVGVEQVAEVEVAVAHMAHQAV